MSDADSMTAEDIDPEEEARWAEYIESGRFEEDHEAEHDRVLRAAAAKIIEGYSQLCRLLGEHDAYRITLKGLEKRKPRRPKTGGSKEHSLRIEARRAYEAATSEAEKKAVLDVFSERLKKAGRPTTAENLYHRIHQAQAKDRKLQAMIEEWASIKMDDGASS